MKLDPQFNQVRTNFLTRKDMPDVSEAYRILIQEENHRDLHKKPIANCRLQS